MQFLIAHLVIEVDDFSVFQKFAVWTPVELEGACGDDFRAIFFDFWTSREDIGQSRVRKWFGKDGLKSV